MPSDLARFASMSHCISCSIVDGAEPARWIAREAEVVSFLLLAEGALAPGHALVVPRRHSVGVLDADPDVLRATIGSARRPGYDAIIGRDRRCRPQRERSLQRSERGPPAIACGAVLARRRRQVLASRPLHPRAGWRRARPPGISLDAGMTRICRSLLLQVAES